MGRRLRIGILCGGRSAEHEVSLRSARNILGAISVNSQLMEMKFNDNEFLNRIAGRIEDAVKRGAHLVDGLLQFSSDQGLNEFHVMNLSQVIQDVHDLIRKSFDMKIKIEMELAEIILVSGDYSGLSNVVMNLCINARDAMPDGGTLTILGNQKGEMARYLCTCMFLPPRFMSSPLTYTLWRTRYILLRDCGG